MVTTTPTANHPAPAATAAPSAPRWFVAVVLAASLAVLVYSAWRFVFGYLANEVWTSFGYYYQAGRDVIGQPDRVYDNLMATYQEGFFYPPPSTLFFRLFTIFPLPVAFCVCGVLIEVAQAWATWAFLGLLERHLTGPVDRGLKWAIVALCVAFGPTYLNLVGGQVNTFMLAACVGYLVLLDRDRPWAAGVVLGLGIWIKLYPIVLLAGALLRRKHWPAVASTLAVLALTPLLLSPWVPLRLYHRYATEILPILSNFTTLHATNQSAIAAALRAGQPAAAGIDWSSVALAPALRYTVGGLGLLAIAALAVWSRRRGGGRELVADALILAITPMLLPLGWGYTYATVAPLVALVAVAAVRSGGWRPFAVLLVTAAYWLPAHTEVPGLLDVPWLPWIAGYLFYSRYLYATLILAALLPLVKGTHPFFSTSPAS